jgi:hypothetical protein
MHIVIGACLTVCLLLPRPAAVSHPRRAERAEFTRLERLLRIDRGGANAVGDALDEP